MYASELLSEVIYMEQKKMFVITGCDSGIGKSLCQQLAHKGYYICASYLDSNSFEDSYYVFSFKMDLRIDDDIKAFVSFIKEHCSEGYELIGLINNAAVALGGPIENLPLNMYRESFEINLFGLISLTQLLIPTLIASKGRIYNMGSMAGLVAMPFLSPYVSTKFALEGFTDSLRREMTPFGIKTVLFEPGGISTPIWEKAKKQDISFADQKYMDSLKIFEVKFIDGGLNGCPVDRASEKIVRVIEKKNPKARYIIDDPVLMTKLLAFLPQRILDRVIKKLFKMDYGD